MKREGQLSPILVRQHPSGKDYQVIFGNRRLEAAKKLGWKAINASVVNASDSETLLIALAENLERDDFSDYEKAMLMEELHVKEGKSYGEIAESLGKSLAYVYQHLAMLRLFPEQVASTQERTKVLKALNEKQARALMKIKDPVERWTTSKLAIGANLCVREIERLCSGTRSSRRQRENSKETIQDIIEKVLDGLNSGDLRPCYDSMSTNYTLFSSLPPYLKMDREHAKEYMVSLVRRGRRFTIDSLEIKMIGTCACAVLTVPYEISAAEKKIRAQCLVTLVFSKINGSWKIVHEHWSLANPLDVLDYLLAGTPARQQHLKG